MMDDSAFTDRPVTSTDLMAAHTINDFWEAFEKVCEPSCDSQCQINAIMYLLPQHDFKILKKKMIEKYEGGIASI